MVKEISYNLISLTFLIIGIILVNINFPISFLFFILGVIFNPAFRKIIKRRTDFVKELNCPELPK